MHFSIKTLIFVVVNKYRLKQIIWLTRIQKKKNEHALAYYNFLRTASWVEQEVKKALKPFGLTHAQLNILASLFNKQPEPMSPNEIKESLLVSSPDVTRLIDRLCKKDLVSRETCPANRRKVDIRITPQGKAVFKKAHIAAKRNLGHFFKDQISKAEAKELNRILGKVVS